MITLKLYISGLCLVVPGEKKQKMTFLFPDVSDEKKIKQEIKQKKRVICRLLEQRIKHQRLYGPKLVKKAVHYYKAMLRKPLKPHRTAIRFDVENRVGDVPSYPLFVAKDSKTYGLWELDREHIHIEDSLGGLNYADDLLEAPQELDLLPTSLTNLNDLGFLSPFRTAKGALRRTKPELLQTPIQDKHEYVRSRLQLAHGSLSNSKFSYDKKTKQFYLHQIDGYLQPIATTLCLTIPIQSDEVIIRATKFDNPTRHRRLILKPTDSKTEVSLHFLNQEWDEIMEQPVLDTHPIRVASRSIQEYLFYFKLLMMPRITTSTPVFEAGKQGGLVPPHLLEPGFHSGETGNAGGNCSPATAGN